MKKRIIISSFILIIIFCTILIVANPVSSGFVKIRDMEGNIEIKSKGKFLGLIPITTWKELQKDVELKNGDMIRTGNDGILGLIFNDNIYLEVDSNSKIVIGENEILEKGRNCSINLNSGRVWAKVKKIYLELTNFEVITPSAVAGVRGTLFSVYTNGEKTTLSVSEGGVELSTKDGENKRLVSEDQMGVVVKGIITLEKQMSEDENKKWKNKNIEKWLEKAEKGMKDKNKDGSNSSANASQGGKPENPGESNSSASASQGGKPENPGESNPSTNASQGGRD